MEKIYQILTANGWFFIEVPNILQKDASPHNIFFKAHLYYYSKYTLLAASSRYFTPVKIDTTGNLRVVLQKRAKPLEQMIMPSPEDVQHTIIRLKQKGWLEYLFAGSGIKKPLRRIKQILIESRLKNIPAKSLLDNL